MNRYIFADNQSDHELRRLQRIEVACDTKTQSILGKTGVARGWAGLQQQRAPVRRRYSGPQRRPHPAAVVLVRAAEGHTVRPGH